MSSKVRKKYIYVIPNFELYTFSGFKLLQGSCNWYVQIQIQNFLWYDACQDLRAKNSYQLASNYFDMFQFTIQCTSFHKISRAQTYPNEIDIDPFNIAVVRIINCLYLCVYVKLKWPHTFFLDLPVPNPGNPVFTCDKNSMIKAQTVISSPSKS